MRVTLTHTKDSAFFRTSHTSENTQTLEFAIIQKSNKKINGILFSVFVGAHQTTSGSKCEESKLEKVLKKPEKQMPFAWKLEIEDLVEYSTGNETLEYYHITCNAILISNKHALVAASCVLRGHDIVDLRKRKPDYIRYNLEDHLKHYGDS